MQHKPPDLSQYKVLMLIFLIEVKYEFFAKIVKSSDQKFVKGSKLKIKHEYLRSLAYICLSLSSPFPSSSSVIVVQI